MNKKLLKKIFPYVIAVLTFILLAAIYCYPILEGKILQAGDNVSAKGMTREIYTYKDQTGIDTYWTGSMFCGMPSYQISYNAESSKFLSLIENISILGLPANIAMIFLYLMGFFVLLRSFQINKWLSIVGAIAIAFSSYFFIIIEAGHNSKVWAIAYIALTIAGFLFIFRKKYLIGIPLTLLASAIGILYHPQMSYYFFMVMGFFLIAEFFIHLKEKRMKDFLLGTLFFVLAIGIGIGTRYSKMAVNREYITETMRGGHSELEKEGDDTNKTEGLDLDYATAWSYGVGETMTLLIPNCYGGSSNYDVGTDSKLYQTMVNKGVPRKDAGNFCKNTPTYWGDQSFTSGPVYVGAIVFFLFILGLFIVKGPYKWALLATTVCSILLAWGHNFMPLTKLFFEYFPFYNKFRAVSSILVVAEVSMPLLGFLCLQTIFDKKYRKEQLLPKIYISAGITAGVCLLFALFGGLFCNFTSANDAQYANQIPEWLMNAIVAERASMLKFDAWRSFIFIALAFGVLWLFVEEKIKIAYFIAGLGLLVLMDMWTVNKRFFSNDAFVTAKNYDSYFKKQPYEEYLLQDKDPHFRVLNLTTNTFNESRTSYYFKSIGGYHAAKLRRYQDLISEHISKMNMGVLDMLNTKYFIVSGQNNQAVPQLNPNAMGNAWFIDSVFITNTPNEECDALNNINLRNSAVVDTQFVSFVKDFTPHHDSTAHIELLSYAPDVLTYKSFSEKSGIIVFSEIYYPYGWKAYIDDQPVPHFRANYTLRALCIPAGEHNIRFEFRPDTLYRGEKISFICIFIMYAVLIGFIVFYLIRRKKNTILNPR